MKKGYLLLQQMMLTTVLTLVHSNAMKIHLETSVLMAWITITMALLMVQTQIMTVMQTVPQMMMTVMGWKMKTQTAKIQMEMECLMDMSTVWVSILLTEMVQKVRLATKTVMGWKTSLNTSIPHGIQVVTVGTITASLLKLHKPCHVILSTVV